MRQLIESAMFERSRLQMDAIGPERLPVTNQIVVLALKKKCCFYLVLVLFLNH